MIHDTLWKHIQFYATVSLSLAWWNPGLTEIKYLCVIYYLTFINKISNHRCCQLLATVHQTLVIVKKKKKFFIYLHYQSKVSECFMILKGLCSKDLSLNALFCGNIRFLSVCEQYFVSAYHFLYKNYICCCVYFLIN